MTPRQKLVAARMAMRGGASLADTAAGLGVTPQNLDRALWACLGHSDHDILSGTEPQQSKKAA